MRNFAPTHTKVVGTYSLKGADVVCAYEFGVHSRRVSTPTHHVVETLIEDCDLDDLLEVVTRYAVTYEIGEG